MLAGPAPPTEAGAPLPSTRKGCNVLPRGSRSSHTPGTDRGVSPSSPSARSVSSRVRSGTGYLAWPATTYVLPADRTTSAEPGSGTAGARRETTALVCPSTSLHAVQPLCTRRPGSGSTSGAPGMPMVAPGRCSAIISSGTNVTSNSSGDSSRRADVVLMTGKSRPSYARKREPLSSPMTSPLSLQSSEGALTMKPDTAAPTTTSAASTSPPTRVRPGRIGSTSRPPGAPLTNAVMRRRRLKLCASTRSRFVDIRSRTYPYLVRTTSPAVNTAAHAARLHLRTQQKHTAHQQQRSRTHDRPCREGDLRAGLGELVTQARGCRAVRGHRLV